MKTQRILGKKSGARRWLVAGLALLLDAALGDPPNRLHPVAWMGSLIAFSRRRAPQHGSTAKLLYGGGVVVGGSILVAAVGVLLARLARRLPAPLGLLLEALLLNMTLALRGLHRAAHEVEVALRDDDLPEARRVLSWHLVSRDTSTLSESLVASAAVSSVAENTSDGTVAPLLFYALLGLPGALTYRFVNTADSMLGYRDAEREWLGKIPARFDDTLNLIPSRLTALSLVAAASLTGNDERGAWRVWRREGRVTASPNAGQPMSATAGALGIKLEKIDHYTLNADARKPGAHDLRRVTALTRVNVLLLFVLWGVWVALRYRRIT